MSNGDEFDRGGASLNDLLGQLLEAQVVQTGLMSKLVEVTDSLARSESRESVAEVLTAVGDYMQALDATTATPTRMATSTQQAQQPALSDDELTVLGQYDELRAALGRTGAAAFYVTATADQIADTLTIVGEAVQKADTVTIGETRLMISSPMGNEIVITNPPDEVFRTPQPKIRLLSGGRVIAVARFITVQTPSTTTRSRG
jgi:hypothetical protein